MSAPARTPPAANVTTKQQPVSAWSLVGGAAGCFVLYALGVLGWQCVTWLRLGSWVPIPASLVFDERTRVLALYRPIVHAASPEHRESLAAAVIALQRFVPIEAVPWSWLNTPDSWLGLHGLIAGALDFVSISAVALIIGVFITAVGLILE